MGTIISSKASKNTNADWQHQLSWPKCESSKEIPSVVNVPDNNDWKHKICWPRDECPLLESLDEMQDKNKNTNANADWDHNICWLEETTNSPKNDSKKSKGTTNFAFTSTSDLPNTNHS